MTYIGARFDEEEDWNLFVFEGVLHYLRALICKVEDILVTIYERMG
jgi:hypothetical protein